MMMKCDGRLDEALQELFFHTFGLAPYVFPDFMGVIEFARVEQADSAVIAIGVHDFENTMGVEPVAAQKDIFDRVDLVQKTVGGAALLVFFRPSGAYSHIPWLPTACAVGCNLSPLRG
jgi:hypothetical protein